MIFIKVCLFLCSDKMELLIFECEGLAKASREKLLTLLFPTSTSSLLTFLMLKVWESKPVDCSSISLKAILERNKITNRQLLSRFIELGASVSEEDVCSAIQCLTASDVAIFKLICSKCSGLDVNKVCHEAASLNKLDFVLHLVELGATLPGNSVDLFMSALKSKDFHAADILVELFDEETLHSISLEPLLSNTSLPMNVGLIEHLVEAGVSLTGKIIPTVMKSPFLNKEKQIDILCMLVEHGVECKQLCLTAQRSTTSLHVATDFALDSGKLIYTYIPFSPGFNCYRLMHIL